MIDPGFGFAKKPDQSIELLSKLPSLLLPGGGLEGFPTLAGPSRKGFIGSVLNQPNPQVNQKRKSKTKQNGKQPASRKTMK